MKRKAARFEVTKAGKLGEWRSDDPNDCMLILDIPNKFLGVLIEELTRAKDFNDSGSQRSDASFGPSALDCGLSLILSGKPQPQTHAPTWLADEFVKPRT